MTVFTIPKNVLSILSILENAGHEAYIVGGCVRDAIRGCVPTDWDVATSAVPCEVKGLFSRTFDTGIRHGTVSVLLGGGCFEVTTYRVDGAYLDNRRPSEVTFASKIEEDLSRRDFTINAIAFSPTHGFVDPFDGRGDILRRVIRCVGEAEKRFGEDALRMLRAVRFAAVLGFEMDDAALQAITNLRATLANISAERIRVELVKLLCGKNLRAAKLLDVTGIMYFVLQKREFHGNLDEIIAQLELLAKNKNSDESMRIALFLLWSDTDCEKILRDLRFDNKTTKIVSQYIRFLPSEIPQARYEIKKFLRILTPEIFEKLLDLKECLTCMQSLTPICREVARDIIAKNECFTLRDLAVNGNDLTVAGFESGKAMGNTLEKLLDSVMHNPSLNTKEQLLCLL